VALESNSIPETNLNQYSSRGHSRGERTACEQAGEEIELDLGS